MKNECCNINEIVRDFYLYLKAYILKKTANEEIAEDIVQEVMLKLVESHKKSIKVNNIKAWLFQVTRNTIADYYNDYYNKNKIEFNFNEDWKENSISSDTVSSILESDFIIPMIGLLPEKYAKPLLLSDIENIAQKEIAIQLNLGLSATKMRIQRGREKLKTLFIECCDIQYDKSGNFSSCTIKPHCTPLQEIEKKITN
ncbi:sigma-70 family RNA polymerase sigma factor [Membranihabitans marinus]|uniref:sigma-70 family RNA polymerase sigma factor n=1 Tax=Membranihabitans marinus TaxID=1227546 RepID=UPI001F023495|nr:sigma-70 family RNA polymerase sigma factor [Membranihabitans marinus]